MVDLEYCNGLIVIRSVGLYIDLHKYKILTKF